MSTPEETTRRKKTPVRAALLLSIVIFLLASGQHYIATTFAGTRPQLQPVPTRRADTAWAECQQIIENGIHDIGDAGRAWLSHAYVGTNQDSPRKSSIDDRFSCKCLIPEVHPGRQPQLSAIVQSFNHHLNIANISGALKASKLIEEIVISEDGSTDGSMHDWHTSLPHDSHFIIRSNNIHELRSYNRAMRMSSGDIVVLMQDDDLLPQSDEWIRNALKLFDAIPELGVLGGYIGQLWDHVTGQGYEYGEQVSSHGGLRQGNTKPLPYIEPKTGLPFMYAECTWIAPVFIRRTLLRKAGGLELTIAQRGEPGVWQDCVFSYEAWVNGYRVGAYSAPFVRGVGGHGSASSTLKIKQRERVYDRAIAYTNRKYSRRRIHDAIVSLNNATLQPRKLSK